MTISPAPITMLDKETRKKLNLIDLTGAEAKTAPFTPEIETQAKISRHILKAQTVNIETIKNMQEDLFSGEYELITGQSKEILKDRFNLIVRDFRGLNLDFWEKKVVIACYCAIDKQNPIYKFYEKEVAKYLKRVAPDVKTITDKQGVTWNEINVRPEVKNKAIEAFGLGAAGTAGALAVGGQAEAAPAPQKATKEDSRRMKLAPAEYTKLEEGFKGKAYKDTKGNWTIGFGTKMDAEAKKLIPKDVLSGKRELTEAEGNVLFSKRYSKAEKSAKKIYSGAWKDLSEKQQEAIVDMVYNMGEEGVRKFEEMMKAVNKKDWKRASAEILDSKYFREDAPNRARRNSLLMLMGK